MSTAEVHVENMLSKMESVAGVNDGGISSYRPKLNTGLLVKQFDSPSVDVNGNPVRAGDVISRTRPNGSFTLLRRNSLDR